jgi:hypothetical protein
VRADRYFAESEDEAERGVLRERERGREGSVTATGGGGGSPLSAANNFNYKGSASTSAGGASPVARATLVRQNASKNLLSTRKSAADEGRQQVWESTYADVCGRMLTYADVC